MHGKCLLKRRAIQTGIGRAARRGGVTAAGMGRCRQRALSFSAWPCASACSTMAGKAAPAGVAAGTGDTARRGHFLQSCANAARVASAENGWRWARANLVVPPRSAVYYTASPARRNVVLTREVLSRAPYTQLVRKISASAPLAFAACSPASLRNRTIHRRGGVAFSPGWRLAGEHIIGGIVHQAAIQPGGGFGQQAGRER